MKFKLREFMEDVAMVILTSILLFGSIKFFIVYTNLDLEKTPIAVGNVTRLYSAIDKGSKKKKEVLAFELDTIRMTFGVYRSSRYYSELIRELQPGAHIKVYYISSSSRININVLQIEKSDKIILDYETVNYNYSSAAILMGFGGLMMIFISLWRIRRREKQNHIV